MTVRITSIVLSLALMGLPAGAALAQATPPELDVLAQRLQTIEADPVQRGMAHYERLQARQALDAAAAARTGMRTPLLQVAQWRVEVAEVAAQTGVIQREVERLERERGELMVEASRQEAARARAEAERMRIQAQIQAEEANRLRQAAEAEFQARQEAEGVLEGVASDQAARLRAARARAAELERREAELLRQAEQDD